MAIGMAIASVALGAAQFISSQKAASRQEDLARANQQLQLRETEEAARREAKEAERIESAARARAAASGVLLTGSTGLYLSEQQKANQDRIRWMREAGKSRAEIIGAEGQLAADTTRIQGIGQAVSSLGSAYGYWKM